MTGVYRSKRVIFCVGYKYIYILIWLNFYVPNEWSSWSFFVETLLVVKMLHVLGLKMVLRLLEGRFFSAPSKL